MRVLVTGGAGFIGSHLVDALLDAGHTVHVLDDYSTGSTLNLMSAHHRGARTTIGTVRTSWDVDKVFSKVRPEVVYHLAAQIDVRASVEDPFDDAAVNVMGTVNVLEACRQHGARRFVLASSAAVYGHHREPVDLVSPYRPISPYGASKAAAEAYAETYDRMATLAGVAAADPVQAITEGLSCSTVILSNVYGPRQREGVGAVNIFVRKLLAGEPVTLYGDGGNVRDYVEVRDAVRTLMWAGGCQVSANPQRLIPKRLLCGTGVGTTDLELLDIVTREVLDQVGPQVLDSDAVPHVPVFMPARPEDIRSMVFAHESAGRIPLDAGVRMLVQELRKELGK